jgi:hypothetical protein
MLAIASTGSDKSAARGRGRDQAQEFAAGRGRLERLVHGRRHDRGLRGAVFPVDDGTTVRTPAERARMTKQAMSELVVPENAQRIDDLLGATRARRLRRDLAVLQDAARAP